MSQFQKDFPKFIQGDESVTAAPKRFAAMWWLLVLSTAIMATPMHSFADSRVGISSAKASIDFRIVVPVVIRVIPVAQPDQVVIDDRHIALGYIDLDAGTSVKLTSNNRSGYQLAARYDAQLLSKVEVRISSQNLTASSGYGSMRVASGLTVDKLVPIGYRMYLAPGVVAGSYRWPVALAFSQVSA